MNSYTIQQTETFHVFETESGAEAFIAAGGEGLDNVCGRGVNPTYGPPELCAWQVVPGVPGTTCHAQSSSGP